MSRTTMRWIMAADRRPTSEGEVEYKNAWRGHMMVWQKLGERHGRPFEALAPERTWALARHPDDPQAEVKTVPYCDRVVMAATFDRAWLARENFEKFVTMVIGAALPADCHWNQIARDIVSRLTDPTVLGVCWQGTSVGEDVWYRSSEDGHGRYLSVEELGAEEVFEATPTHYTPEAATEPKAEFEEPAGEGSVPQELADGFVNDPEHYRRMCQPFNCPDDAQQAANEFFAGVRDLRDDLGIADVVVLAEVNVKLPAGENGVPDTSPAGIARANSGEPLDRWAEMRVLAHAVNGDASRAVLMLARTLVREQDRHLRTVLSAIDGIERKRDPNPPLPPEVEAAMAVEDSRRAVEVAARARDVADRLTRKAEALLGKVPPPPPAENPPEVANPPAAPPV